MKFSYTILFLLFSSVPLHSLAQNPPIPPPPPPKSSNYNNTHYDDMGYEKDYKKKQMEEAAAGFRVYKISAYADFQLGMLHTEYDSLIAKSAIIISTEKEKYTLQNNPSFTGKRLSALVFQDSSSNYKSDLSDIEKMLQERFSIPDKEEIDSSMINNKESKLSWSFEYYDITYHSHINKLSNGDWKGSFRLKFEGNKDYKDLLKYLEQKGK
jgi:hypothetical protein